MSQHKRRANGEGTIYQRKDGRWEGAAYVLTMSGVHKRVRVYGRTREEARRKLTALLRQADQGVPVVNESWTVERYLTYWLAEVVKVERRPKTYQGYEGVIRLHLIPALGKKRLARLGVRDVRLFLNRIAEECQCCKHKWDRERRKCCAIRNCCRTRLSVRMVQSIHAVLRNALQNAVREEIVLRNVAKLVQVTTPKYKVNRGLSVEQVRKLLMAARADRLHALYVLALYLGLRRAELLGLRWSDINLGAATLEVNQTLQRVNGALRFLPPKTENSKRTIPLPRVCVDALREHREQQVKERFAAGSAWREEGLVFTTRVGTPIEPDNLRRSWYPLRETLDMSVRFHDLRHTCVTLLLDLGVPPHIVREIVGHSDIGVTMTIYAHASLDERRRALQRLDDHLK